MEVSQARLRLEKQASEAAARATVAEEALSIRSEETESLRHRMESLVSQQQADLMKVHKTPPLPQIAPYAL